jgi:hypothetical protein
LEHFVPLVEQGIAQAARRVLHDEQEVPAAEKILSLLEEHTQIITRQKMGKPREFGRKVLIDEVDGGIISRYEVLEEVGREHPHLPASLEAHQEHFGGAPELVAGDRGLYSAENERLAQQAGVKRIVLPKSGPLSLTSGSSTRSNAGSGGASGSERASKAASACSIVPSDLICASITEKKGWEGGLAGASWRTTSGRYLERR